MKETQKFGAADRLKTLLNSGYFPPELPPLFTTQKFAAVASQLVEEWDITKITNFWTLPETYSIPRWNQVRRKLSIVNPVNQFYISYLIAQHWDEIAKHLNSPCSEFHPLISVDGARAINGVNFDMVARRKAQILADFGRYVKTDIVRFYPSIYTHSVAWAILTKKWVKKNHKGNKFKKSFPNLLDKAISAGQAGQTIGIPIGPDTSRVISELVACAIDKAITTEIKDYNYRCVRYVDDMIIGLSPNETSEAILSKLAAPLGEFHLELNANKTELFGVGISHAPHWKQFLKRFVISGGEGQLHDIDSYFHQAIHLADQNSQANVLSYAVRRATGFQINNKCWQHFVNWMLYTVQRSSACLSDVVGFLVVERQKGRKFELEQIRSFIHRHIRSSADASHTAEVAWLLFWSREFGLPISSDAIQRVIQLPSGVIAVLTMDLHQRRLITGSFSENFWKSYANDDGLKSEMWLAAYEITLKGWWQSTVPAQFLKDHEFFGRLLEHEVSFYDVTKGVDKPFNHPFLVTSLASQLSYDSTLGGSLDDLEDHY